MITETLLAEDLQSMSTEHLLWCLIFIDKDFPGTKHLYGHLTDSELRQIIELKFSAMQLSCQIHQKNIAVFDILNECADRVSADLDVKIAAKSKKEKI